MPRLTLLFLSVLFLAACAAPGPRISTTTNPATDFSSFKTFGFMSPAGTDRPNGVRTPLTLMLQDAVAREFHRMGLVQSDDPDFLVNFHVAAEERTEIRQVPTMAMAPRTSHGYWRGRYSTWGSHETWVHTYAQGTLVIDLVDPRLNMLAWEGVAQQRLGRDFRQIDQERVDSVVAAILAEFERLY
jgi:hypothetical protein